MTCKLRIVLLLLVLLLFSISCAKGPGVVLCYAPDVTKKDLLCRTKETDDVDLATLASRKEIATLELHAVRARSLAPLAQMTWLQSLSVEGFNGGDGEPPVPKLDVALAGMTNLKSLTLYETKIDSLEALRNGSSLQTLAIRNSKAADLTALTSHRQSLTMLYLSDMPNVTDDGALIISDQLKRGHLALNNVGITKLDVSRLTKLKLLKLSYCAKLTHLRGLSSLTDLEHLAIPGTPLITDLSAIGTPPNARIVNIVGTKSADLTPLAQWKSLTTVVVSEDIPKPVLDALTSLRPDIRVLTPRR